MGQEGWGAKGALPQTLRQQIDEKSTKTRARLFLLRQAHKVLGVGETASLRGQVPVNRYNMI